MLSLIILDKGKIVEIFKAIHDDACMHVRMHDKLTHHSTVFMIPTPSSIFIPYHFKMRKRHQHHPIHLTKIEWILWFQIQRFWGKISLSWLSSCQVVSTHEGYTQYYIRTKTWFRDLYLFLRLWCDMIRQNESEISWNHFLFLIWTI